MKEYIIALKGAMKGELESIHLYENALRISENPAVSEFFRGLIEEEKSHFNYLLQYMHELRAGGHLSTFSPGKLVKADGIDPIIDDEVKNRIASSSILFSAISTAALLERKAVEYYDKCASESANPELKALFSYLSKWEARHMEDLIRIEKETQEDFWRLNQFEPF